MRDDAAEVLDGLSRRYAEKLRDLNRLLQSEQEKLHCAKSGNLDKVFELIESDNGIIDLVDLADYDIARDEERLARIIGTTRAGLYDPAGAELAALSALRNAVAKAVGELYEQREALTGLLVSEHRKLREDIDGISRINRLKRLVPE